MNRVKNSLKIGKKALSLVMASIMVLSVMGGAIGSICSFLSINADAVDVKDAGTSYSDLTFVVPETIYLKPNSNVFQYFLNNNQNGKAVTTGGEETVGTIWYTYSGEATISYEFFKTDMTSVSTTGIDLSSSKITSGSKIDIKNTSKAPASNTCYYIRWKIEYPAGVAYAYTYVYAPYLHSVAATSAMADYHTYWATNYWYSHSISSVIFGFHELYASSTTGDGLKYFYDGVNSLESTNNTNYRTDASGEYMPGGKYAIEGPYTPGTYWHNDHSFGNVKDPGNPSFYSTASGTVSSMRVSARKSSTGGTATATGGVGKIYVDKSRFKNFSQIPNFTLRTDYHGSHRWNGNKFKFSTQFASAVWINSGDYNTTSSNLGSISAIPHAAENDNTENRPPWQYDISVSSLSTEKGANTIVLQSFGQGKVEESGDECNVSSFVACKIVTDDRSALRDSVNNATKQFARLGVNGISGGKITSKYFDNGSSNGTWAPFANAYYNAVIALTKVNSSCDAQNLANALDNALKALKIKVTIDNNTGIAAGDSLADYSGITPKEYFVKVAPSGTVLSSVTLCSSNAELYNADGSVAYSSYTAPTLYGYKFVGWSTNASATSGTTSAPSVGYNQTWYCIWTYISSYLDVYYNKSSEYDSNLLYFKDNATTFTGGNASSITLNGSKQSDGGITITGTIADTGSEKTVLTDGLCADLQYGKTYVIMFNSTNSGTDFYAYTKGSSMGVRSGRLKNPTKICDGLWSYATIFTVGSNSGDTDATDRTWQSSQASSLTTTYNFRMSQASDCKGDYIVTDLRIFEDTTFSGSADVTEYKKCNTTTSVADPSARTGYVFKGYTMYEAGKYNRSGSVFTFDGIEDARGKLLAHWVPIQYKITYDGNGSTGGSTPYTIHTYDSSKALETNGFEKKYTITYDYNDGFLKEDITGEENYSKTTNGSTTFEYSFNGWNWNGKTYSNSSSVKNLVSTARNIDFVAQWESTPKALENPTRPGYVFKGWYSSANGGTLLCAKDGTYTATENITLYAHWEATTSNVTLKYDNELTPDGRVTNSGTKTTVATYGSNMIGPIIIPERTGYIFDGYYGINGAKKFYNADGTSAHKWNITNTTYTLTPKWKPITYTVKYNGNGATTNNIQNQTFKFDKGQNLSNGSGMERKYTVTFNYNDKGLIKNVGKAERYSENNKVTQDVKYIFNGWKRTDSDSSTGDWFVTSGETKKTDYSISDWAYNLTSKNDKVVEMTAKWSSQSAWMPSPPSRPGYTFGGWYENAECTGTKRDVGVEYTPTANKSFYAKWIPNEYTTTYVYDLADSKTGHTFKMTADGTMTVKGSSGKSLNTLILYPFKPVAGHSYKVEIYDVSGNTGASNNVFVVEPTNENGGNYTVDGKSLRKNIETADKNKTGTWTFDEDYALFTERIKVWLYVNSESEDKAIDFKCKVRITDTTTGEIINICSKTDKFGDTYGTMPKAAKTGYSFEGWFTATTGGTKVDQNSVNFYDSNKTYYARWKANEYTVKYNGNGGVTSDNKTSYEDKGPAGKFKYDVYKDLEANKFCKDVTITYNYNAGSSGIYAIDDSGNYDIKSSGSETKSRTFLGWSDSEELAQAGMVNYTDTQSVVNLATSNTKDVYAVWEDTSTVTLPKVMRLGYTFEGWYKDASCTVPAQDSEGKNYAGDPYTYSDACMLYAKWSVIQIDNKVVAYDSIQSITADLIDQNKVFDGDTQIYGDIYSERYDDPEITIGTNNRTGKTGEAYDSSNLGGQSTVINSYDDNSKVEITGSGLDTQLIFTPEKLTSVMEIHFECKYRDYNVGPYQYVIQSIIFVPANSIFLEDGVFESKDSLLDEGEENEGSDWEKVEGTKTDPGEDVDNYLYLHDKVQGYNKEYSYNGSAEFSNGTALKATVSPEDLISKAVEYRFYGTGFDLYSDCGPDTSDLVISVWKMESASSNEGTLIQNVTVDTCIEDETVLTVGDDNETKLVRQIPVYHYMTNAGYYLVQVRAYYDPDTSSLDKEYGYIDGIRIYNRVDESSYAESEKNAKFFNILQYTRNDNQPNYSEFEAGFASIDASPVNEIYLAPKTDDVLSGTVFNLDGFKSSNNGKVMISLRAAAGTPTVKISNATGDKAIEITLTHATEMYYDITEVVGNGDIYIVQTSDTGYAAICNLKITNSTSVQLTNSSVDLASAAARFEEIDELETVAYVPTDERAPHAEQPDIIIPGGEDEEVEVEYTVSFNLNGHGSSISSQKVKDGDKASAPTSPVAEGYSFGGWYKEAACTNSFNFNTPITADITLYAKWTKNKTDDEDKPISVKIDIVNYVKVLDVEYKSTVVLTTTIAAPDGYEIVWSNGQKGNTCTIEKIQKDTKVYAKVVNKNNSSDVIGQTETEEIKIKDNTFFGRLIAIFKEIFKALPVYKDNKKIK